MKITKLDERPWESGPASGIDKAVLWRNGGGVAVELYRLAKGVEYPRHTHEVWEQMFVIEGRLQSGTDIFESGDYVFTEPGEEHKIDVLEDSLVLLSFGKD